MTKELQDLNTKAKRKLYYLKRTYGLEDLFNIKTEFKNKKEERDYLNKLKEFLFSSKFKYIRGGKIMFYRKSNYGTEYYYPIKRSEWQEIQRLIKKRNKNIMKKQNKCDLRFFRKFRVNRKLKKHKKYRLKPTLIEKIKSKLAINKFKRKLRNMRNEKNC